MCLSHVQTCSIPPQLMFKDICLQNFTLMPMSVPCQRAHTRTHTRAPHVSSVVMLKHACTHVHHMCHLSSCSNTHAHTHTHTHTLQATQARLPHCRRKGEGYEWTAVTENCRFSLAPCSRRFLQQEAELRKGSPPSPRRETRMAMIPGVP